MTQEVPKLGRPPLDLTARAREIMTERGCCYGTAYAQMRREKQKYSSTYLKKYPYLTESQCYILQKADEVRAVILEHESRVPVPATIPTDPVDAAREGLRQAKLGEYNTEAERTTAIAQAAEKLAQARLV